MSNHYQLDEEKGRVIFDEFCKQQTWCNVTKFSKNKYTKWDVLYTSGATDNHVIGEIKRRKNTSNDYDCWFLQKDKYEALLQIQSEASKPIKITYINHFTDGATAVWDLDNIAMDILKIESIWCQKNDYTFEKEEKDCYLLPLHTAKLYYNKTKTTEQ